jgi:hypothetical protein
LRASVIDLAPVSGVPNDDPSVTCTRSTRRFKARMTPMRASFVGLPCSATSKKRVHRGLPFFGVVLCLGQLGDVERRVAQGDQTFCPWAI